MKKFMFPLLLFLMVFATFYGVADEHGSFRFELFQGGAMGMEGIDVTVDAEADVMSLWAVADVTSVVLEKLSMDTYLHTTEIFCADSLSSNQIINLRAYLYDVIPAFRITCKNQAGDTERWYLADSGEDGSLLLLSAEDVERDLPNLFDELRNVEFVFSSGAGAWSTFLSIEDGAFYGAFHDSDMGDCADAYPNGTVYGCQFHGMMTYAGQIDEYAFGLRCDELLLDEGQVPETIQEGVRYITVMPYGFENADTLTLYMPGCPITSLPEGLLPWLHLEDTEDNETTLQTYALYNAVDECGFIGIPNNDTYR